MNNWQQMVDRSFRNGYKKGEYRFTVLKSRGTGKSMFAQNMIRFRSPWTKWESEWSWKPRVSSRSGKIIWGNIMVRENKIALKRYGGKLIECASPKEALSEQREEFKGILSRG